jgi:hypothetical protein
MNDNTEQYSEDQLSFTKKYNLSPDDFWEHHGNLIIKHNAVMRIAEQEHIKFRPIDGNMDGVTGVALMVEGDKYNDDGEIVDSAWAFGEASSKNCTNAYLWCMAEKRGKDRVTLQLLGGYWHNIMSDVEADEFRQQMGGGGYVSPVRNGVATDKQISFIRGLVDKHYLQGDEETAIMESIDGGITKQEAGDIIEKLKSLPLRSDMGEA